MLRGFCIAKRFIGTFRKRFLIRNQLTHAYWECPSLKKSKGLLLRLP